MTKQKVISLILIIFSCAIINTAYAQVYRIESFDGDTAKISLDYTLFSKKLKISCSNDSLFLDDYSGTVAVHVLNKRFLQIVYNVRGGTGTDIQSTAVLSVSKNKINISMLATFYKSWFSPDKDNLYKSVDIENHYKLNLIMKGNNKYNYKIIASVYDQQKSKRSPQTNYKHNAKIMLKFDTSLHIFYSTNRDISKYFGLHDPKVQQGTKQFIKGIFPVITLGKNEYYYIRNEWYEKGIDDDLYKYSHR